MRTEVETLWKRLHAVDDSFSHDEVDMIRVLYKKAYRKYQIQRMICGLPDLE